MANNYKVFQKVEELLSEYDALLEKSYTLYRKSEFTDCEVNTIAIECCADFERYKRNKYAEILSYKHRNIDGDKIDKILSLQIARIRRHSDYLSENTLGTTLNLLEETYANVQSVFKRNTIAD